MGRNRASNMAAQGATTRQIKQANPGLSSSQVRNIVKASANNASSSSKSVAAPAPVSQPKPTIQIPGQWRYVDKLNAPGTTEYKRWTEKLGPGYDGGGWVGQGPGGPGDSGVQLTDDDLRAWSKATSLGPIGSFGSWKDIYNAASQFDAQQAQSTAASPAATQVANKQAGGVKIKDAKGLNQALRIAGSNGNISKRELKQVTNKFSDGDYGKSIQRLDKVNSRRLDNNKAAIGLGAAAYNSLASGKLNSGSIFGAGGKLLNDFGKGSIGSAVQSGMRTYSREGGMRDPLKVQRGQSVTGMTAKGDIQSRDKYLASGSGGFTTSASTAPTTQSFATDTTVSSAPAPTTMNTDYIPPTEPAPAPAADPIGGLFGGGSAAMGAMGIKSRRSSRKLRNLSGRGTGQLGRGLLIGNAINIGR